MSDNTPTLNDCGCCEGIKPETPVALYNPPGLSALAYRVGTHSRFKQSMHAGLTGPEALRGLTTRSDDDPTIGLLDAYSVVLDVLTFYQERIANERFWRTATERRSLLELARSIGYELRPGVAAATWLAFTLETGRGAPREVALPAGAKAQSVPGQDEQAQMFETIEDIVTRPAWNALVPQLTQFQELKIVGSQLLRTIDNAEVRVLQCAGGNTGVSPGDLLLFTQGAAPLTRTVLTVTVVDPSPEEQARARPGADLRQTKFELAPATGTPTDWPAAASPTQFDPMDFPPQAPALPFEPAIAIDRILSRQRSESDLQTFLQVNRWNADDLAQLAAEWRAAYKPNGGVHVFAFRDRAGFFGNTAPVYSSLRTRKGGYLYPLDWDAKGWTIWKPYPIATTNQPNGAGANPTLSPLKTSLGALQESSKSLIHSVNVFLDRVIAGLAQGGWTVFTASDVSTPVVYKIVSVHEASPVGFGMSGKATGLALLGPDDHAPKTPDSFLVRSTVARVNSVELPLAAMPVADTIEARTTVLTLDRMIIGLRAGQQLVLSGEQQDAPGVVRHELLELKEIIHYRGLTTLLFATPDSPDGLQYAYRRHTVTLNANVALATHGETKREVLGSGDAAQAFQQFLLKQSPLTYVSAPTPAGLASTLELRVNDVRWDESSGFYGATPQQRTFTTRRDDDNRTSAQTGNGVTGARLPTGVENVTAKYRVGLGVGGMVRAGQVSLLLTRPPGLKEVVNPLPASGGADPETRDQARDNAPLTVMTLDRIVSLQDFEDYARAYPGIGKALATWLWDGENQVIHLTISGANGSAVAPSSMLYDNLRRSIEAARDPGTRVRIGSYAPLTFDLVARLLIHPAYLAEKIKAAVTAKIAETFSFASRQFGQGVTKSELLAAMQSVEGVEAVDLDKFHLSSQSATLEERLPARAADWNAAHSTILPAELLLVNLRNIQLTEMPR